MFCTKCGYEIKDGYKFCPKCGTPAYVEKEEPKGEVKKEEVDKVTKGANVSVDSETVVKPAETVKKTAKVETASKSKKEETDSRPKSNYIPNPFMAKELDIEGIKKRAEQGDRYAMSLQCYRYEMGIGTEIDMEKHNELIKDLGVHSYCIWEWISLFYYSKELATPYTLTKNQ